MTWGDRFTEKEADYALDDAPTAQVGVTRWSTTCASAASCVVSERQTKTACLKQFVPKNEIKAVPSINCFLFDSDCHQNNQQNFVDEQMAIYLR